MWCHEPRIFAPFRVSPPATHSTDAPSAWAEVTTMSRPSRASKTRIAALSGAKSTSFGNEGGLLRTEAAVRGGALEWAATAQGHPGTDGDGQCADVSAQRGEVEESGHARSARAS